MKFFDECFFEIVEEEKNNLYFFLKGGFNKLECLMILSLILKLSFFIKFWINEYVFCGFLRV